MPESVSKFCGLHAAHVVISTYNNDGKCKCLNCSGVRCQHCQQYKDLLDEADRNDQIKLERCISCLHEKQR